MNPQNQHLLHMSTIFKFLKISIFHAIKIEIFFIRLLHRKLSQISRYLTKLRIAIFFTNFTHVHEKYHSFPKFKEIFRIETGFFSINSDSYNLCPLWYI